MKILLVNSLYAPLAVGGAELSVQALAEEIVVAGHQASVLTLRPAAEQGPIARPSGTVQVIEHELSGPWVFDSSWHSAPTLQRMGFHAAEAARPHVTRAMRQVLHEVQPDIVNTHNIAGFGTSVWMPVSVPLIHSMHDYYLLCPRTLMYRNARQCDEMCADCRLATIPRRHSRRRPDGFTAVSAHLRDVHRSNGYLGPEDLVEVVPNSVTVAGVPERKVARLRTLGFIGRLEAAKGLGVLLAALAGEPGLADLDVVVAGRGTADDVAALGRWRERGLSLTFLGYVPPVDFFSRVDCVCVPTQWAEPYGRVAAEARSLNIPVVASRTGGLVDALSNYEGARFVDDFSNPRAWVDELLSVRREIRDRLVGSRSQHSVSSSTRHYLQLFEKMMSHR